MFIKAGSMLINLDNVTNIAKRGKKCIRICFFAKRDYVDLEAESEEELDRIWEKLTGVRAWRWTPVDEALPEESTFVVVTSKCGERLDRVISYYNSEEKQFVFNLPYLNYCGACVPNVVAWMPLPEPYKEGEQE